MKVSEAIERLQQLKSAFGDLPVRFDDCRPVQKIEVYNENGCDPQTKEDAVEICLH